jgi:hypothetical protein
MDYQREHPYGRVEPLGPSDWSGEDSGKTICVYPARVMSAAVLVEGSSGNKSAR